MRYLITLLVLALAFQMSAQNTSGIVIYEEIININLDSTIQSELTDTIEIPGMENLSEMLKEFSAPTIQRELKFTSTKSSFKVLTEGKDEQVSSEDGEQQFHFVMMVPEEETYIDIAKGEVIEQKEFLDKKFLIEYDLDSLKWKITGEQKMILGMMCLQAIAQCESDSIQPTVAWFCPSIPVSGGPDVYGQLPGLILELTTSDGQLTYLAKKIEYKEESELEITPPSKGKKVSKKKYEKIVEAKTKEMKQNNGGEMMIEIKTTTF